MKSRLLQRIVPFLLSLTYFTLNAQTYHPMPSSSAQWNVARCWFFYPGGWHDEYALKMDGSDTIYNGRSYQKIFIETHHAPGTQYDSTYTHFLGGMREANKQVFFISEYQCIDTIERMVYDFNATQPGDTIFTQVLTNGLTQYIPHIVVSLDSVLVGNEFNCRINLRDENDYFTESWIEGIGSSLGLTYATYWLLTDNSYDLTCFYNQDELNYTNPQPQFAFCSAPLPDIQCSSSTSVRDISNDHNFIIFPNPAIDVLNIAAKKSFHSITIINEIGKRMLTFDETYSIELNVLHVGFYFVQFRDKNDMVMETLKFIKL